MNLARVQYHLIKRADESSNPEPSQGPLQRGWNALKGAWQAGQSAGKDIQEYAKNNPLLDWSDGTREHLGDTYTENIRRLANAWDYGAQRGEQTAAENEENAKNLSSTIRQVQKDPKSVVPEVQQAEQSGMFSRGLNNLISWGQKQQAEAAAKRKAEEARRATARRADNNHYGWTNESALERINRQAWADPSAFNYSIPVDQLRFQNAVDPTGRDEEARQNPPLP